MEGLKKLVNFLDGNNKYIRVDDRQGWGSESSVPGCISVPTLKGNGLRSIVTGEVLIMKDMSIRRANHLELQLRRQSKGCVKVEETIKLCDMFPDQDIVIVSKDNVVQAFAPVIKKRSEVFNFITLLQNHLVERRAHGKETFWNYEGDMMDLALYLHRNHPEREDDKSIIDRN